MNEGVRLLGFEDGERGTIRNWGGGQNQSLESLPRGMRGQEKKTKLMSGEKRLPEER